MRGCLDARELVGAQGHTRRIVWVDGYLYLMNMVGLAGMVGMDGEWRELVKLSTDGGQRGCFDNVRVGSSGFRDFVTT